MQRGFGGRGGGMRNFDRPVRPNTTQLPKTQVLRRLWHYVYRYRWLLLLAALMTVAGNSLSLMGPLLSGSAVDAISAGEGSVDFERVFRCAGLMLVFYAASALISYLLATLMIRLSRSVVYALRKDAFDRLVSLPVGFFDRHQTGEIISVISYDVDTISASLSHDLLQACASFITVGGSFLMMLRISPRLILIFAVTVPISLLFTRYRSRKVRPLFRRRSEQLGRLNGFVEEITGGQKAAKAYHREQVMLGRFDERNEEAMDAYFKAEYYASVTGPSVNFINNISLALISMFGALLYMQNALTLGNISSFVLYSRRFSGPINEFANILGDLQSAFAAAERVLRLIDSLPEPPDSPAALPLSEPKGDVQLENVSFGYEPGQTVLHSLSLHAAPGQTIAIVGPTGAGKTTIINLLMRFYDVNSGAILVDGCDIRELTRETLRGAYTMVLQETWLFYGTIFENIAYGKEGVTLEQVRAAASAAHIDDYIMSLPAGYDTLISGNGANISKGQKQLLTIARAMLLDSRMLILDEATSNVDTQTERRIQSAMLALMRGRTCFVIAHRLSTIQNADLILVLREGDIVEQGSHEDLLAAGGYYSELYHAQFEVY